MREAIVKALSADKFNALANEYELRFAENIARAFADDTTIMLAHSGTESVRMAIRLERTFTRTSRCANFEGHYHGRSDQGVASSWLIFKGSKESPEPTPGCPGVQHSVVDETPVLHYGSDAAFSQIEGNRTQLACILCEDMPSGLARCDQTFLQRLRDRCHKYHIVLMFDEVVTGSRVTHGRVQRLIFIRPVLTCLGKSIGGALPCGTVVGEPESIDSARTTKDPCSDTESKTFVGGNLSGNAITSKSGRSGMGHQQTLCFLHRHCQATASAAGQLQTRGRSIFR